MSSKPIFISHAVNDKPIASFVSDMLQAMGVNVQQDVFCSSLAGLGIPSGKNFREFIKEQIQEPKLVLLVASKQYVNSQFCLAEMGAAWALAHHTVPIIVPGANYDDIKSVMEGVQACRIDSKGDWDKLAHDLQQILGLSLLMPFWNEKSAEHLTRIDLLLKDQKPVEHVTMKQYEELSQRFLQQTAKITHLELEIRELKKVKDATKVAVVLSKTRKVDEQFELLCADTKSALGLLETATKEAVFLDFLNLQLPPVEFGDAQTAEDRRRAVREHEILEDEGYDLVRGNKKVSNAIATAKNLKQFLSKQNEEFEDWYEDEYGDAPDFKAESFWKRHLY
jgi:hypothetical protein